MKVFVNYLGGAKPERVGILTELPGSGRIVFEYDPLWTRGKRELSPIHLPNSLRGANAHDAPAFQRLHGLFYDCLPDRWGMELVRRYFESLGRRFSEVGVLEILSSRGARCMGALSFEPDTGEDSLKGAQVLAVQQLALQARLIEEGHAAVLIPALQRVGGSAGGMRPKAVVGLHPESETVVSGVDDLPEGFSHWLLKFDTQPEREYGRTEMAYSLMAREAGIAIPPTRLLEFSHEGVAHAHFAIRRFDREGNRRLHIQTFAALTQTDFNLLNVDYSDLLGLSLSLTNNASDAIEMFRRAAFNVFCGNSDDHGKNHSFLMEETGEWTLAPAYDITWSTPLIGRRATAVMGDNRQFPGETRLMELAERHEIEQARSILARTKEVISQWPHFGELAGMSKQTIQKYQERLVALRSPSVRL